MIKHQRNILSIAIYIHVCERLRSVLELTIGGRGVLEKAGSACRNVGVVMGGAKNVKAKKWAGWQLFLQGSTGRNMGKADGANW